MEESQEWVDWYVVTATVWALAGWRENHGIFSKIYLAKLFA